jgi:hypothetical protein
MTALSHGCFLAVTLDLVDEVLSDVLGGVDVLVEPSIERITVRRFLHSLSVLLVGVLVAQVPSDVIEAITDAEFTLYISHADFSR